MQLPTIVTKYKYNTLPASTKITSMSKPNPSVITSASNPVLEGPDRRAALKLLKNYSESSARINLLKVLISEGFGLQEVEKFSLDIQRKFRSKKSKNSY